MLNLTHDIDSLSNFKRDTARFRKRMRKTGEPVVLTVNGRAEFVVQDAAAYQRMLELAEQVESLEFLRRSLEQADQGKTVPMRQAIEVLGRRK